jgi:hypothetical protein
MDGRFIILHTVIGATFFSLGKKCRTSDRSRYKP